MATRPDEQDAPIAILCALPEERIVLLAALEAPRDLTSPALRAHRGRLDGHDVIVAEAGIGKVQAAVTATILLERHGCGALVLSGVAGGLSTSLEVGDLVVASSVVDLDYGRLTDAGRILYRPGTLPLPTLPAEPTYALPEPQEARIRSRLREVDNAVAVGTILSGDAFLTSARIRDELAAAWSALAIEMEGSAVCGVAERFGVPWLIVRALSDRAGEDSAIDFERFVASAAADSARLVRALLDVPAPAPD